ncbi:helix-turn-helix transcriptional regulator [Shewanella baltica]|uniref:helix-turn-helix transcriptional regulator n=1 Tax=Shewanella baltica TaxID=62322 RepID=UPI00217ED305|nr:helix-turn-helix transcriptional regulator [Shewanella baltica]MCS6177748.1 helix-turn-helix transcriptional regulator [Shewanella baltica]MCS6253894.1 helix-turn-helix transcriptional regulator [Shewanella baltica]
MNNISTYRKKANLSQSELGKAIGKTQGAVGNYEAGIRNIDLSTCWEIVRAINQLGVECTFADVFPEPSSDLNKIVSLVI